jgi:hypothetical protein
MNHEQPGPDTGIPDLAFHRAMIGLILRTIKTSAQVPDPEGYPYRVILRLSFRHEFLSDCLV